MQHSETTTSGTIEGTGTYGAEHLFIGFDCAYRTLGWCIIGYNPRALIQCARESDVTTPIALRNIFTMFAGGIEDVLGECIDEVDPETRAKRLSATLGRIAPADVVARATVIIERQPRKHGRGFYRGAVHDSNQTIESQILFYYSAMRPARRVYLISAGKKNRIACSLLGEQPVKTYNARKAQSRRAYVRLAQMFNFDAFPQAREIRRVKADRADACVQIIAAIFLCARDI